MTPAPDLRAIVESTRRRIRAAVVVAIVAAVAAAIPAALLVAWLLGAWTGWRAPSIAPLVLELVAALAAGGLAYHAVRRWLRPLDAPRVAADTESRLGLPPGELRSLLELQHATPPGTSEALIQRAGARLMPQLLGRSARELEGALGERARRRRTLALASLGALVLLVGVLGFASPDRSAASWSPMLHPVAHLSPPPLPPISVEPGNAEVARGSDFEVRVRAPGRTAAAVAWRAQGDVPRQRTLEVIGDNAVAVIPRVETPTTYWVTTPDGARSERFTVTPVDPMLVADLVVEVRPPAYVGRGVERYQTDIPPLEVEEGTTIVVSGRTTRPLAAAMLESADASHTLDVDGGTFTGRIVPTRSGVFAWTLRDATGSAPALDPAPLEITLIADAAPQAIVTFPGTDTVIAPDLRQLVAGEARDDYGLSSATLVSWRVSAQGEREPAVEQSIDLASGDRALLRAVLDATERGLLPGDTLKYLVRVTDNSPRRQVGESDVYALWLPGRDALRQEAARQAEEAVRDATELARAAESLQQSTTELERRARAANARRSSGNGGGRAGDAQQMGFQEAQEAGRALAEQERMVGEAEAMRERLESLIRAMRAAGLEDAELQQRMQELRDLYDQLLTPELREQMEQMRRALENLDPEEVQRALEQMAGQQEEMRAQLARSMELLRRAALEQEMSARAQEARELATQQRAMAEEMKQGDASARAADQRELAQQSQALAQALAELEQKLESQGEQETAQQTAQAAEQTQEARQAQQQAAQQAQARQQSQAQQSAEQAAQQLEQAAQALDQARGEMSAQWKSEVEQQVQQATQEALALAERQQALLEEMKKRQQGEQPDSAGQGPDPFQLPSLPRLPRPEIRIGTEPPPQSGQGQRQGEQHQGREQQGQQQSGGRQQGAQQQGQRGAQQGQQGAQQQAGAQGAQQAGQGQQQAGQQGAGQQQGQQAAQGAGQQQGGQGGQQQGGSQGGQQGSGGQGAGSGLEGMRSEQAALQQGLQQLGRNLNETGQRSGMLSREVGAALGRANVSMQQTLEGLAQSNGQQGLPTQEAEQTVDALNRLALALLNNAQQMQQQESGTGLQQALQQLADAAQQQGSLNGQTSSLLPMNLSPSAMARELQRLSTQQRNIAHQLDEVSQNVGGRDNVLGDIDALAREAEQIARQMEGGRLTPETRARQERLFHRLLDAGRSLERDEQTDERVAERPGGIGANEALPIDPALLDPAARYRMPTPEELNGLPPAYRRLVLEYFERLNRARETAPEPR